MVTIQVMGNPINVFGFCRKLRGLNFYYHSQEEIFANSFLQCRKVSALIFTENA